MSTLTNSIGDDVQLLDGSVDAVRWISTQDLRAALLDGAEIALIDIREGDAYAAGHISVASPVPDSELELRIGLLVPRHSVRLVVVDDTGSEPAAAAVRRLTALGYDDVRALSGGVADWAASGFELIAGLNSLSKALGEFVERRYHTPRITVEQLKAKIDAGEDIVVIDTRPLPEFTHVSIPTGQAAPGAELLFRAFDRIPSPSSQVVVNCAGRTRAIIGAQALINAGIENPVVALENGTSAWQFAGFEPARGQTSVLQPPTPVGLAKAVEAANRIRSRFGVRTLAASDLATFRAEADARTVYLLDVRTNDEFRAGHLPGAHSAPGGQLVQATDLYIGTRNARVVLVDDADTVRATVTASWLIQLGLDDVFVYGATPSELIEHGDGTPGGLAGGDHADVITATELKGQLDAGEHVTVIDLQGAPAYFEKRRYVSGSLVGRRSTLVRSPDLLSQRGRVVLTSADGVLARLAASELGQLTDHSVVALDGGTDAWAALGFPYDDTIPRDAIAPTDLLPSAPTLDQTRATFAKYVQWGNEITAQLERDGIVVFRAFEDEPRADV
jgi:rhodanese-related sulfurtransferase